MEVCKTEHSCNDKIVTQVEGQLLDCDIVRQLVSQSIENELDIDDHFINRSILNQSKTDQRCYVED